MENIIYSPSKSISIRINEDKMSAWMYIHKSDKIIDEKEIINLIDNSGIVNGFEEALEWMSENGFDKDFEKPFPIAICKSSVSEIIIKYHFEKSQTYDPQSEWSFQDIKNWFYSEKGTVLADLNYSGNDIKSNMRNIFGELVSDQSSASKFTEYLGKNVTLDIDNKRILSEIRGYPYIDNENKLNVTDNIIYNGDIDSVKSQSNLAASITINGSIRKSHFTTANDIIVNGNIIASEVYTEGNLTCSGDIIDCQTTGVVVIKDTLTNSIINSLFVSQGLLTFDNTINCSRIIAEKGIKGNEENSSIIGSQVLTSSFVDVCSIGNVEGVESEIEITMCPYAKERLRQMNKTLLKIKEHPNGNSDKIAQFNSKLFSLEESLAEEMDEFLNSQDIVNRFVKIRMDLFKGIYIRILKKSFYVKHNQANIEFNEDGDW